MPRKRKPERQRRPKGDGSVYQNADGSWSAAVPIDGRTVRRRAPDAEAAEALRASLVAQRDRGVRVRDAQQPLAAWAQTWLLERAEELSPNTIHTYRDHLEGYALPLMGRVPLGRVDRGLVQSTLNRIRADIRAEGRYDGAATVRNIAMTLHGLFAAAVEERLIGESPMDGIRLPRYEAAPVEPLTDGQLAAVLAAARAYAAAPPATTPYRDAMALRACALIHCYALLGLRRGEAPGLTWGALDLDAGTVRVAQQVQEIGGRRVVTPPKSRAGTRTLPLVAPLPELLRQLRAAWLAVRVRRADTWEAHDLVFCNRDGSPLWPRNVNETWYAIRDAAGLPAAVKLHHLRHTWATLLDECGASDALKSDMLGHAKRGVTQRYTHARLAAMRAVLDAATARIRAAGEDSSAVNM